MPNEADRSLRRPMISFGLACSSAASWIAALPLVHEGSTLATWIYVSIGCVSGSALVLGSLGVGDARRRNRRLGLWTAVVGAVLGGLVCLYAFFVVQLIHDAHAWNG